MNNLTTRDCLTFRIQTRSNEPQTLLCSRRLFQKKLVDVMESKRLDFIRKNKKKLRFYKYSNLNEYEEVVDT